MGSLIGPTIASKLMQVYSPWTPLFLAYFLFIFGSCILFFIPETLQAKSNSRKDSSEGEERPTTSTLKSKLRNALAHSSKYVSMLKSGSVVLILLSYLIHYPVFVARGQFFAQYFSKRFDWQLADTGYLLSLRGLISVVVLLIALPALSKLLVSPSFSFRRTPSQKDLLLAQISALSITIGALLLAGTNVPMVISGVLVITLGDGLSPLCRSLATSFVDSRHTASLYVLIGVFETIGLATAGPILAWLFTAGMKLKGIWLGMPYFWVASIAALATFGLLFVKIPAVHVKLAAADALGEGEESSLLEGDQV